MSRPRQTVQQSEGDVHRRTVRWWRIWTLLYFVALTTGTHWPRLDLTIGQGPPPDKVIHLFAFGTFMFLLWQCRLLRNILLLAVSVMAWAAFDEITQSLPMLHRESSWMDIAAGWTGIACAALWIWATAPLGGELSRLRRKRFDRAVDERLSSLGGWMALGVRAFLYGVLATVLSFVFIFVQPGARRFHPVQTDPFITAIIAFCLAFLFGVLDDFDYAARTRLGPKNRRVFTWLDGLAVGWLWTLGAFCVAIAGTGVLMSYGYDLLDVPQPLRTVAALATFLVFVAFLVRGTRHHWAAKLNSRSNICHVCGYDLRGHLSDDQSAVCPECGNAFVRPQSTQMTEADT